MNEADLLTLLETIFGDSGWPRAVRMLEGLALVRRGLPVDEAAKQISSSRRKLQSLITAPDRIAAALGAGLDIVTDETRGRARRALGQMLVGRCAEMDFSDRYRSEMHAEELQLVNVAEAGTDTDYRLINGQGRKLYRINIKFHGSQFRSAREWVGLDPEDTFALATYKIRSALEKQEQEGKPYFFAIVGVPNLTAERVGADFPTTVIDAATLVLHSQASAKRKFEDAIIDYAVREVIPVFSSTYEAIERADWYILSARKADLLLREKLYDRVFALRIRNFARVFRGAEVDMHFSLSQDLVPLTRFFEILREDGVVKVSTLLERGDL